MNNTVTAPPAFTLTDLTYVAAGAAVLGSGGGGSYNDGVQLLQQLADGPAFSVPVGPYDGASNACVLAMMGSPDAGSTLQLADLQGAIGNTLQALTRACGGNTMAAFMPVELGALNSLVPLLAAIANPGTLVIDGDGAGRAVPQLVETTFSAAPGLAVSPTVLGNSATDPALIQSTVLNVASTAQAENLARGIITSAFGSIAGFAGWPSLAANQYALSGTYLKGTLSQAWALGRFMLTTSPKPGTQQMVDQIGAITGRGASAVLTNYYITEVTQNTAGGFDSGIVRLDNTPTQAASTDTHYLYNTNESLIMYAARSGLPDIVAPDSICYYSESSGLGFSNSEDDLVNYNQKPGTVVSIIKIKAAAQLSESASVMAAFATLLRQMGYAGALPAN
jgi:DUF917 family protein